MPPPPDDSSLSLPLLLLDRMAGSLMLAIGVWVLWGALSPTLGLPVLSYSESLALYWLCCLLFSRKFGKLY